MADKTMIKWEILPTKNLNGQYEIVFEYNFDKDLLNP